MLINGENEARILPLKQGASKNSRILLVEPITTWGFASKEKPFSAPTRTL